MMLLRVCSAAVALVTAPMLPLGAALPDYKLGEVAAADVVTPVPLLVVNPEATEALKQKVSQQVPFIVRLTPQSADEAVRELRESIATARVNFLAALQQALDGRAAGAAEVDSPAFAQTLRDVARVSPKNLPLGKLAPLWVRGQSDEALVDSLLQPVREVMAQPVSAGTAESPLPANQSVRLISVKNPGEVPTVRELESAGPAVASAKIITLWRARRLVETYFPAGQEEFGKFAATFVRGNAYPDTELTEILRAKRLEGVTVNDTYEAAQVIVKAGQTIDRKALAALAVLREKSLIGSLQTKLEQEQSVAGQIRVQTKWIAAMLVLVCSALAVILWRLRARPSAALALPGANPALGGGEQRALPPPGAVEENWRHRALAAEGKAERAHEAIRSGALGWMREKIFRALSHQRGELLSTQQKAEAEMRELEQRLEQLHTPLQERIGAYEKRIEELEKDLAAKGEENRELLGARITVARQQLNVARERGRGGFSAN